MTTSPCRPSVRRSLLSLPSSFAFRYGPCRTRNLSADKHGKFLFLYCSSSIAFFCMLVVILQSSQNDPAANSQPAGGSAPAYPEGQVYQNPAGGSQQAQQQSGPSSGGSGSSNSYGVDKILMAAHSWESPLTYDNNLADWDLASSSIPAAKHVVLTPAVLNRRGFFVNKSPVRTTSLQMQFQFEVRGNDATSSSDGFAFWYLYDNFSKSNPRNPTEEQKWGLFGNKNQFEGLGVFFSCKDRNGMLNPSISAMIGDGSRIVNSTTDVPTNSGVYYKFRNTVAPLTFKITANSKGIIGELRTSPSSNWITCFQLPGQQLRENGYIGFTAYTGSDAMLPATGPQRPNPVTPTGDLMTILNFTMHNLDLSKPGEDNSLVKDVTGHESHVGDFLRDHSHHKDQRELTEATKQLTRLLYKHMSEQEPRGKTVLRSMNSLTSLVQKLSSDVREMKKEVQMMSGLNHTSVMNSVKSELSGLKNLVHKHSQHHANSLHSLTSKFDSIGSPKTSEVNEQHVAEIRELSARAQSLEQTINIQSHTTSWLAIGIMGSLVCFGLFVWKRFRDMEKKHYL